MTHRRFQRSTAPDGLIVYDLAERKVVREITDYALYLQDGLQLSMLTIEQRAGHLIRFLEYLHTRALELMDVSDSTLRAFRDDELANVIGRSNSLGSHRVAKETVNQKLAAVYGWLLWLQEHNRVPISTIGLHGCRVTLVERMSVNYHGVPRNRSPHYNYPALFRLTGARSRHRLGLSPTRETMELVSEAIMRQPSTYIAHRDALMVDIATEVGLRRASITSLTVKQFDRRVLESTSELTMDIKPTSQKFSYANEFPFPVWLALRVLDFIEGPRYALLTQKPRMASNARDHVFLSARSCAPLENRSVSQNISRHLRSVGAGKGASMHAFRRLFANEQIEMEIDERLQRGLDTSTSSICAAVSERMGHSNPMSLYAYVAAAQSRRGLCAATQRRAQIETLAGRVRELEAALKKANSEI